MNEMTFPDNKTVEYVLSRARYKPSCPVCHGPVYRVPRRALDRFISLFAEVRRFRCMSPTCVWEGNVRKKLFDEY